jgi:hypothetical protein
MEMTMYQWQKKHIVILLFFSLFTVTKAENISNKDDSDNIVGSNSYYLSTCYPDPVREDLTQDKEFLTDILKNNAVMALYLADNRFRYNREFVLSAIRNNGRAIEYAPQIFLKNKEIVLTAMEYYGEALNYADKSLKQDTEFMMKVMKRFGGYNLRYAGDMAQANKKIVLAAVQNNGLALLYISNYIGSDLTTDKEIALTAVKQNSAAYEYVGKSLKQDKDILAASKLPPNKIKPLNLGLNPYKSLTYDHEREDKKRLVDIKLMKMPSTNKQEIIDKVSKSPWYFDLLAPHWQKDKDVALAAVKASGSAIDYLNNTLQHDVDILRAAAKTYGVTIKYALPCSRYRPKGYKPPWN